MSLLTLAEVTKRYEGVQALNRVSLQIEKGTIKGLIGPNGSGKSTLFHLISGMERPDSGRIFFREKEITSLDPHKIALMGLGRTFQTIQPLGNMTAVDNILTGMDRRLRGGLLSCGFWLPRIKRSEREALKEAKGILEFVGLLGRWEWPASQLSFGEQKMLDLGRAIALRPELLLLDEPAAGLPPAEVDALSKRILKLREDGMTIFLVEHRMEMVMEIADEIAAFHHGEVIAEGSPDEVRRNDRVIETYTKGKKTHA
jgi:branched-chain amino acid transport system ATP-binding protein